MGTPVFVDGAAGTTGLEIVARLEAHPEFEPLVLDEALRKDANARREALNDTPFAVLCLPDDAAREAVAMVDPESQTRIVDASSAHRVADGWTYGFPEIVGRDAIAGASRVSNPGCYPTGFLGLIAPLTQADILHRDHPRICHAVSGYSGGGKALIELFEGPDAPAYRAYALTDGHKHQPEMMEYAELSMEPLFSPAVIPAYRGMIVDVPLTVHDTSRGYGHAEVQAALAEFFEGSSVITVAPLDPDRAELVLGVDAPGWDGMELFVHGQSGDHAMRLSARLDNLGKGASGAAIQNLNLMAGFPETASLRL